MYLMGQPSSYLCHLTIHVSVQRKLCPITMQGLVDFRIGLVNSVHNLSNGQVKFFGGIQITEKLRSIILYSSKFFCAN